ncbi:hypothetical protein N7491_000859 [Penicillium cf. griseofulvum]|uniref:Uncharacterized protein n=1 Tax=Penicillium cf. griseofulvum TaxID=2972120 RepID=A0A9W9IT16_9EURO|nr:hypothetical protein N7472_011266 [Penicillium cf. griseofulvum]KAJ5443021.1 hypothetical protein N7445_004772 [Penicillium cf. griseofulvum]KAJ5451677.1 hypothetical protein N7491_000859 [Penicillium cf. griseofulvum]
MNQYASQAREAHKSPGSITCNDGKIRALIQTSDGERHYFSGTISTDLDIVINNAQVEYFDLAEDKPHCQEFKALIGPVYVNYWWQGGAIHFSGRLLHCIDETIEVTGEGWWGDIDDLEYEANGEERYSDESDDPKA